MKIKKVGAMSLAKIFGLLYAIFGLIGGLIFTLIGLSGGSSGAGFLFGIGAVIFLPIAYGLLGFVGGLIMAWLYNFAAGKIGGIEIETE